MNLYIKVVDNKVVDHPVLESNLVQCFGGIPENYVPFINSDILPGKLFHHLITGYQFDGTVVSKEQTYVPFSAEEKAQAIQELEENKPFASWSVNTETGEFVPPVPSPLDGNPYMWDEDTQLWVTIPAE